MINGIVNEKTDAITVVELGRGLLKQRNGTHI